jgi:hydroxyethylthiazole kinase-like sugar kinase family protein
MSAEAAEMEDLSRICGGLLINIGTMLASGVESARLAGMCEVISTRSGILSEPIQVSARIRIGSQSCLTPLVWVRVHLGRETFTVSHFRL